MQQHAHRPLFSVWLSGRNVGCECVSPLLILPSSPSNRATDIAGSACVLQVRQTCPFHSLGWKNCYIRVRSTYRSHTNSYASAWNIAQTLAGMPVSVIFAMGTRGAPIAALLPTLSAFAAPTSLSFDLDCVKVIAAAAVQCATAQPGCNARAWGRVKRLAMQD